MTPLSWRSRDRQWCCPVCKVRGVTASTGKVDTAGDAWGESYTFESVLKAIEEECPCLAIFNICLLTFTVLSSLQER